MHVAKTLENRIVVFDRVLEMHEIRKDAAVAPAAAIYQPF